uniref:Uncharacterized protein n=1 Tax=Cacopsylla melanoneura TaxID=428564 RepID=A0A8D8W0H6_9HEMI
MCFFIFVCISPTLVIMPSLELVFLDIMCIVYITYVFSKNSCITEFTCNVFKNMKILVGRNFDEFIQYFPYCSIIESKNKSTINENIINIIGQVLTLTSYLQPKPKL